MSKDLVLYDRSRVTTDWRCPRQRYWNYEFQGKGLSSKHTSLELFLGTTLHDGLAAIAIHHLSGSVDIDLIADTARQQVLDGLLKDQTGDEGHVDFASEQASLIEGLLRGFLAHSWPRLIAAYPTIVYIEREMTFTHDGLTFMSRPDLILADPDGNLWYIEFKSTSSKKEGWVNSWQTAVQLHSTCLAVEETIGESVTGVIVQGLYKGYESYGKQSSPFCYAYRRDGTPPFSHPETRYDYRSGFKRVPVWDLPGGTAGWVHGMPADILGDQFPQTPPIFINPDLVRDFFTQRSYREHEIRLALDMIEMGEDEAAILNATFPQRFDQCRPYFGRDCTYLKLCHGPKVDPFDEGFVAREPHHALEVEQDAKEDDDGVQATSRL